MKTTAKETAPYLIRVEDGMDRSYIPEGIADNLESAINAAWQLQRYTEAPVIIWDNRDGPARKLARVYVEWLEE